MKTKTLATASLLLALVSLAPAPAKKAATPPQARLVPIPGYTIRDGDDVQLYCSSARGELLRVAVAADFRAFCDMQKAIHANDTQGLDTLIDGEKSVWLLDSGTRVKVLRKPTFSPPDFPLEEEPHRRDVEVRILDGPKAGSVAVAPYEYVRACRTIAVKTRKAARRR